MSRRRKWGRLRKWKIKHGKGASWASSGASCLGRLQRGVQGGFAHLEPCRGLTHVQPLGDVLLRPLQLLGGHNWLASAFSPTSSGSGQSSLGAVAYQVAFKLPQCPEHMKNEPPADAVATCAEVLTATVYVYNSMFIKLSCGLS